MSGGKSHLIKFSGRLDQVFKDLDKVNIDLDRNKDILERNKDLGKTKDVMVDRDRSIDLDKDRSVIRDDRFDVSKVDLVKDCSGHRCTLEGEPRALRLSLFRFTFALIFTDYTQLSFRYSHSIVNQLHSTMFWKVFLKVYLALF